jgi:hypothetical protein
VTYSLNFKLEVIEFAKSSNNHAAARKYKVDVKQVREWKKQEEQIKANNGKRMRLEGGGRKLIHLALDEEVLHWIECQRKNKLRVTRKMIKLKAKSIASIMNAEPFAASEGWLWKFLARNHLSLRRVTTVWGLKIIQTSLQ